MIEDGEQKTLLKEGTKKWYFAFRITARRAYRVEHGVAGVLFLVWYHRE